MTRTCVVSWYFGKASRLALAIEADETLCAAWQLHLVSWLVFGDCLDFLERHSIVSIVRMRRSTQKICLGWSLFAQKRQLEIYEGRERSRLKKSPSLIFRCPWWALYHVDVYLARLLSGFPDSARFDLDVLKVRDCLNNSGCKPCSIIQWLSYALQISHRWISTHTMDLWSKSVFLHVCDQKFSKSRSMQEYLRLCNMLCLTHRTLFAQFGTELLTPVTWANLLFLFPHSEMRGNWGMHIPLWNCLEFSRRSCLSTPPSLVYLSHILSLGPDDFEPQKFEWKWCSNPSQVRRLAPQYILMDIASPDAIFLRAAMAKIG